MLRTTKHKQQRLQVNNTSEEGPQSTVGGKKGGWMKKSKSPETDKASSSSGLKQNSSTSWVSVNTGTSCGKQMLDLHLLTKSSLALSALTI